MKSIVLIKHKFVKLFSFLKNTSFYLHLLKLRQDYKDVIVNSGTQIVIEGFPRSANTFAFNIFKESFIKGGLNPKDIAHHVHSFKQISAGIEHEIPVLVLIRDPLEAVASLIVMQNSGVSDKNLKLIIDSYLYQYLYFYTQTMEHRNKLMLVEFNEVVNNYDIVIGNVNKMFNTNFEIINVNKKQSQIILSKIEDDTKVKFNADEKKMSIPSKKKISDKNRLFPLIEKSKYYQEASSIYKLLISTI